MDLEFPSLIIAFFAGLLSFVSPCVLPLVPAYIGYMSGRATRNIALETGAKQKAETTSSVSMRFAMITHGLAFVMGFTVIFVAISIITAVFVGAVGGAVTIFTEIIGRVGGVIIVFFGLHFMGLTRKFFRWLKENPAYLTKFPTFLVLLAIGAFILIGMSLIAFVNILLQISQIISAITSGTDISVEILFHLVWSITVIAIAYVALRYRNGVITNWLYGQKESLGRIPTTILMAIILTALILWGFVDIVIGLPVLAAILLMFFLGGAFTKPGEFWLKIINTIEQTLYMDTRPDMQPSTSSGLGGSFMMGIVFSAGWTPCIGPLLGTILTVAARTGDVPQAAMSLTAYSLGLGIPFLITAGLMEGAQSILRRLQKHMGKIELVSGLLLVIIGISVATGSLQNLSQSLSGQTELATRIEECGLGLVEGSLDFGQASSCLNGSLKPVFIGQTVITEFSADDTTQSFLFEIEDETILDVELAGVKDLFDAEVLVFDAEGNELGRGSEFVEIDENKYVILSGLKLSETGEYTATLNFLGETDEPFTFRFRVREGQEIEEESASNTPTTISIANSNLGTIEALAASSEAPIGLEIGNRAPDFTVMTLDGEATSLSSLRGQIVLVNFWGTWCGPCVREMPELQSVYEQFVDEGFTILALATRGDTRQDVLEFREEYSLTFTLAVDEGDQITDMYSIVSRPSTIIVDEDGLIVFKHFGPVIEEQLIDVLNEIRSNSA